MTSTNSPGCLSILMGTGGIAAIIAALLGSGGIGSLIDKLKNEPSPSPTIKTTNPSPQTQIPPNNSPFQVTFSIQTNPIVNGQYGFNVEIFMDDEYKGYITNEPFSNASLTIKTTPGRHQYKLLVDVYSFEYNDVDPINPIPRLFAKESGEGTITVNDGDTFVFSKYNNQSPFLEKK
ncbi:MAG: hypothetical protein V7K92_29310 [Nostoc sp.]|uniref:hypothetical protein n=1 Tax=Nostoc sp. TaxID=1180 RepID=UPI002FEFE2AB